MDVTGPGQAVAAIPSLVVAEVFSPTVQGEGPSAGRRAGFIRLMGCNLHCSWCDTGYTWDASRFDLHTEATRLTVGSIIELALKGSPDLVVITGGEPLLHQDQPGWIPLIAALGHSGVQIEVETNGTQVPAEFTSAWVTRFNVSPKLAHAGDPPGARINPAALRALNGTGKAVFKFVCRDQLDVAEAAQFATDIGAPAHRVWIMPEGTTPEAILTGFGELTDAAIAHGFNVTTRLHVLAWPTESRGR